MSAVKEHDAHQREIRRGEELEAARQWIAGCHWAALAPLDPFTLTPAEVRHVVERRYCGGWPCFVEDQVGP